MTSVRFRIDLGYDGTAFSGWATQPGRRTVQQTLEHALQTLSRAADRPKLTVAGRTDAGVHATGQVAHVDLAVDTLPVRRLNQLLPSDVSVTATGVAPVGFDARFSALSRRYVYRIADRADERGHDPLRRHDTLAHPRALDAEAMRAAALLLVGEHDFAAFCRRREGAGTVRRLLRATVRRDRAGILSVTVEADAFCHHMVRSLVGALIGVGEGRHPPDWPAGLLASMQRACAVTVAPAHGLTLVLVRYPPPGRLAARAERTRRHRPRPSAAGTGFDPRRGPPVP